MPQRRWIKPLQRPAQSDKNKEEQHREDTKFYKRTRWRKVRLLKLQAEPLCRACKKAGRLTPATMVDHIVPIKQGGDEYDDDNLQALCDPCHQSKRGEEAQEKRRMGRGMSNP